ncbi:hypothetical protein [Chryseobacterium balustinum]|uniref:Uncharacterized protein n=1 Tax=Chryseobacterium balustinum TaxID=246 RepID=A0AAX2IP25_9FLAO|nr:hypothetical protein [Chryseobacterium balustinum]AZB29239.1 hypothetical protein EB354_08220 [Chryseobacterium balustinum]SKB70041.1 hypothetical protein SAMN05421800_106130 [Chryseobacterium balustinum]SQA91492.1 Uncharacterised protein [Chryseobacterium balustinum]
MYHHLILFVCTKKDPLVGTWKFTYSHASNEADRYKEDDYSSYTSYITLSGDNSFLFVDHGELSPITLPSIPKDSLSENDNNTEVYFGTWSVKDSIIYFETQNHKNSPEFTSKIISKNDRNMKLNFPQQKQVNGMEFKYKKDDYNDVSRSKYNFTANELNKWRIKNKSKQTKEKIRSRIENALQFSIAFLEYHESENKVAMTLYLEPLPFKFYGNGIALKNHYKNEKWNDLFYDEEDASIAYDMLKKSFNSVASIPDEISINPIKINIFILKETLKNLK